jgi:hypothetical protein
LGTKAYSGCAKTEYAKMNTGTRRCDRACQTRECVGDEGKHRCCQYRACKERDQLKQLHAMSERRLAEKDSMNVARRRAAKREGADVARGCRSRRAGVVMNKAMTLAMKSCWT